MSDKADMHTADVFWFNVLNSQQLGDHQYPDAVGLSEERMKSVIRAGFQREGCFFIEAGLREKGPDFDVKWRGQRLLVEVKGEGTLPAMFNNFFLAVLGEILQRMNDERAEYVVVLPAHKKFVRLARALPPRVRERLNLHFWFVSPEGEGHKVAMFQPQVS